MMNIQTVPNDDEASEFRLDAGTKKIYSGVRSVKLTNKEFSILQHLVSEPGRVVERDELLERVWGPDVHVTGRTIDAHIVKLRRKMKGLGEHAPTIETVWALGYRLRG